MGKQLLPAHTVIRDTYTIAEYLGEGAFGAVYKVRHKYLGIQALKVFHPGSIPVEHESELFNEAFILSKLTNEHIVRVYEANTFSLNLKRYCYIAMEFIKDGTLDDFIKKNVRISIDQALEIQRQICLGLSAAHRLQPPVVHRDVKPQNILVSVQDGNLIVKVSDFGQAKHVDPITRITEAAGTIAYLPPEGFWNYESAASDVYSAGIIFYILLTGVAPFPMPSGYRQEEKEIERAVKASRNRTPDPPSKFNNIIDAKLDRLVLKALDPNIKSRYANAVEFYDVISHYQLEHKVQLDSEIDEAIMLGKQFKTLNIAIQKLEHAISQRPANEQKILNDRFKDTLNNWKKGMAL